MLILKCSYFGTRRRSDGVEQYDIERGPRGLGRRYYSVGPEGFWRAVKHVPYRMEASPFAAIVMDLPMMTAEYAVHVRRCVQMSLRDARRELVEWLGRWAKNRKCNAIGSVNRE